MNRRHLIAAAVILALLGGIGWALSTNEDAEVSEAIEMRDAIFQKMDTLSDEERRAQFHSLRQRTRDFSDEQRAEFGRGMRQFMMQRVDRLLAMAPEEQDRELDRWIDRMEEMRRGRESRGDRERGEGERGEGGQNQWQGRDRAVSSADRDQRRKQRLDRTSPEMRAKMDAMKDLINARRAERGLEPIRGGRGMFRRDRHR